MKIFPLSEGAFTVDRSKEFIPFDVNTDDLQQRSKGSILVEIQPFVIITSSDILLLDTGLGFTDEDDQMQVHKALSTHGIQSTDVTKVLMTHLHKDHSGGIMMPNKKVAAFENAIYYINKQEWEVGLENSPSYRPDNYKYLRNIRFTQGDGEIDGYIQYIFTGAHCPYHQAFKIKDRGETIFCGGDVASQYQQLKTKYKAKYDYDPQRAMELRQEWREEAEAEGWKFLFYHDIKYPMAQF